MASTASTTEGCSGCSWCEENKDMHFTTSWGDTYTSKEACFELKKFTKAVGSSPDGLVDEDVWVSARDRGLPEWDLIDYAISYRRGHEEKMQMQRRELFLQQQQQSSPLGSALFKTFPAKLLKHIASYLAKPSQALFAVSLGIFDMSSITAMSAATNRFGGGQKRNSDGSLREEPSAVRLADIPAESLVHILGFIPEFSQASFNLAVATADDELLNKNSFAIVGDQCWDSLDFGEIERELAMRLSDDDIKAVLWCINAANKMKRLSLAHCVDLTGTCLEPLGGSAVIEHIDLSLVGKHESPTLFELWHPPQQTYFVVTAFEPPLSFEIVLPILDSIIGLKQCSLQHLQFPQAWREKCQIDLCYRSKRLLRRRGVYDSTFTPDPSFVSFLSRYNQLLMNRGTINCVNCSRDLPRSGYELVGSIFGGEIEQFPSLFTFGNQHHTCSQCLKHYCYRCDSRQDRHCGWGEFTLERCDICEKDQCEDCSRTYCCVECDNYYCMDCNEGTTCSESWCGRMICSDCDSRQCDRCEKGPYCSLSTSQCGSCDVIVCKCCDDFIECSDCLNKLCGTCALEQFDTCQQCKNRFCGDEYDECDYTSECQSCNQTFCQDCVTLPQCGNLVPGSDDRCRGYHCVDCPDESYVELARTCSELSKEPCDSCRSMESNVNRSHCDRCSRMWCKTWQIEKKKLKDDQLNESMADEP